MTLARIVQHLAECPQDLEGEFVEAQETEPESIAIVLAAIRRARADLAEFADEVEKALLAVMGERNLEVPGVGLVEVKKATRRTKWQNHDLMVRVVARALDERAVDETTGEYESEGAAVARVLEECARPSWRLGPLRALGLDPDEWCEVDEGTWSIKMPGPVL